MKHPVHTQKGMAVLS